jgi:hypothetical protein
VKEMRKHKNIVFIVLFFFLTISGLIVAEEQYFDCVDQGACEGDCWCRGTEVEDYGNCHFQCKDGNRWYCGGPHSCIAEV